MKTILMIIMSLFFVNGWALAEPIKLCISPSNYAPYKWNDDGKMKGALIDLVDEMFKRLNMDYTIDVVPWKRCHKEVENFGKVQRYEAFLNGAYNQERDKKYLHSVATHQTTWAIYYSEKDHPKGLDLTDIGKLGEKYSPCAELGSPLRKEFGISEKKVIYSISFEHMFKMMSVGRCDFRPTGYELSLGARYLIGEPLPDGIITADLTGIKMPPRPFHAIWISRSSPRGIELQTKFNATLTEIKADGTYDKIFKYYWDLMKTDYVPIRKIKN